MPMEKLKAGVEKVSKALYADGGHDAAKAIMTTDTVCKEMAVQLRIDGKVVHYNSLCSSIGYILLRHLQGRCLKLVQRIYRCRLRWYL